MSASIGWLPWLLWTLCVVFEVTSLVLLAVVDPEHVLEQLMLVPAVLGFPTVGALIATRRPENAVGWLYCITPLLAIYGLFSQQYFVYAVTVHAGGLPGAAPIAWLGNWFGALGWVTTWTFTLLLFPTGRLPSPHWRLFAWTVGCVLLLFTFTQAVRPGPLNDSVPYVLNPFGIAAIGAFIAGLEEAYWIFLLLVCGCTASVIARFRTARGVERQQLKWFAYAACIATLVFIVTSVSLAPPPDLMPTLVGDALLGLAMAGIPAAVGVAILRHHLYDIDSLINRTLVYAVLTGVLAAVYLGCVVLLQASFRAFVGQESDLAIVASTLAVATLFLPLRQRIQAFIDRGFYRSRYDAAAALTAYSATLQDNVGFDQVRADLLDAVQATVQPAHVSLWLRDAVDARGDT